MNKESKDIQKTYLVLTLLSTLSTSFIYGINTLFLLDAGLSITQAFAANAFFTLGQVLFEIPTGIVADTFGRRTSYLLGVITLFLSTVLYLFLWEISGPFSLWAFASILLGLGFTFFSGATEAWIVDALKFTKFDGELEDVFAKAQWVGGVAMLTGAIVGGALAQFTNLGVPYILRCVMLLAAFAYTYLKMHDLGFSSRKMEKLIPEVKASFLNAVGYSFKNKALKYAIFSSLFTMSVMIYVFYATQPFLLKLYGDDHAFWISGLTASLAATAQIIGGMLVPKVRKFFKKRSSILILCVSISIVCMFSLGFISNLFLAIIVIIVWSLMFAGAMPIRSAYINGLIPSEQRATVLSVDSLVASAGGVASQPALGKIAQSTSYETSFIFSAFIQILYIPLMLISRMKNDVSDDITSLQTGEDPPLVDRI